MAVAVPLWNITVITSEKVTQVSNPVDLSFMRKEFDTFEVTIENYVPLRFLGLDDNKVHKKRAIRVMDGGKPYEVGFDEDTTFKLHLFQEGDIQYYTIEGGTANVNEKKLIQGGSLGPREFITFEQRTNYYNMQVFVKNMYYLRPSKYTDIESWYQLLKSAAKEWDLTLYPKILSVATDIVDYCRQSQDSVSGLLEAVKEIRAATGQDRQDIVDGVKQILQDLKKVAEGNQKNAADIVISLGNYSVTLRERSATGVLLGKTYEEKIGDTSLEVTQLKDRIRALNDALPGKREKYHEYCLIAETTPTYLVAGLIGLIVAAVVAGVYGDKAVKILQEIQDDENEIQAKTKQLADDQVEIQSLTGAESDIVANLAILDAAIVAVNAYRGTWGAIAGDLQKNIDQLDRATPDKPFSFQEVQLKTLGQQWKALEDNADQFRVTAFIIVKPA